MLRNLSYLVLCNLFVTSTDAQNLVTNPGFEDHIACPTGYQSIGYSASYDSFVTVQNWVSATSGTPDYFHECGSDKFEASKNFGGFQLPHSGNAYAGFIPLSRDSVISWFVREYLGTKLASPMIAGRSYYVSMYVSPTALTDPQTANVMYVDQVGMYFSTEQVAHYDSLFFLKRQPDISSTPSLILKDTLNWTKIEGVYTASGGEEWLTIGRFMTDTETDTVLGNNYVSDRSYMYVDDVCVTDIAGHDSSSTVCMALPGVLTPRKLHGNYLWNTGATTESINIEEPGVYWRTVADDCLSYSDTIRVVRLPEVWLGDDTALCSKTPIRLNKKETGLSYNWSTGDNGCCITPKTSGTYTLEVYNECGSASDDIEVSFYNCDHCVTVPSVFSPNNDGRNDRIGPLHRCAIDYTFFSFRIFDRWGVEVYHTSDPMAKWDGTYRGTQQDMALYYYQLQYISPWQLERNRKRLITMSGDITLVR